MSGVNDNTPTPLLDNIQTPTNNDDITQNTLTLAMIRELIESKKKQEKEDKMKCQNTQTITAAMHQTKSYP